MAVCNKGYDAALCWTTTIFSYFLQVAKENFETELMPPMRSVDRLDFGPSCYEGMVEDRPDRHSPSEGRSLECATEYFIHDAPPKYPETLPQGCRHLF